MIPEYMRNILVSVLMITNYRLNVGGYSGTAGTINNHSAGSTYIDIFTHTKPYEDILYLTGEVLDWQNGISFTTYDRDNDR